MNPQFKILTTLPETDRRALFDWGIDIFCGSVWNLKWRQPEIRVVGYLGDQAVTHVGLVRHVVRVGGQSVTLGGVGAVATAPAAQKRGWGKKTLLEARRFMSAEWRVDYGHLFCPPRLVPYYGSLGWKSIEGPVTIDQPMGKITAAIGSMVLEFEKPWPGGPVDLESLPW